MSHQEDKIRKLFQDKIEGIGTNPPTEIWDGIENELFPKQKKKGYIWFYIAALFVGVLTWYVSTSDLIDVEKSPKVNSAETIYDDSEMLKNKDKKTSDSKGLVDTLNIVASTTPHPGIEEDSLHGTQRSNIHKGLVINNLQAKNKQNQLRSDPKVQSEKHNTTSHVQAIAHLNPLDKQVDKQIDKQVESQAQLAESGKTKVKLEEKNASVFSDKIRDSIVPEDAISPIITQDKPTAPTDTLPEMPHNTFQPKQFLLVSSSLGRELRNYQYNADVISNYPNLIDTDVAMRYRALGISYQRQFKPSWSWGAGILLHRNRFITRLFPIKIANDKLDDQYEFTTSSGELKSSQLNLGEYANSTQDTTVFLGRIIHKSAFLSIPLTVTWSTQKKNSINFYIQAGFQFNLKTRERNTIVIRNSLFERSFDSQRLRDRQLLAPSGLISLGISSPANKRFQFYGALTYAQLLGNYHKGSNFTITSKNINLTFGLMIPLK